MKYKNIQNIKNADMLIQVLLVFLFQKTTSPIMIRKFMATNNLRLTTCLTRHTQQNNQSNDLFTSNFILGKAISSQHVWHVFGKNCIHSCSVLGLERPDSKLRYLPHSQKPYSPGKSYI